MDEEVEAWRRDEVEEAEWMRMDVEVGANGMKMGEVEEAVERRTGEEEVEACEWMMGGVVEMFDKMGEEVEAYERRQSEGEVEALVRS